MRFQVTTGRWCALAIAAAMLAGCSSGNSTRLPDLEPVSKSVMSPAEQERAIKDMLARKESHEAKAIEEIKKSN